MGATQYNKEQLLQMLRDDFDRWEAVLAGMTEEQAASKAAGSDLSTKDVLAHLWAWQQISVARQEAALRNGEPQLPAWPKYLGPDLEEDVDQTNKWIYETYKDKPWANVYKDWCEQYLRFIELASQVPEEDMLAPGRYPWMGQYALSESMLGSYEHHEEHLEPYTS